MSTALVKPDVELQVHQASSAAFLAAIAELSRNPDVDVDKMSRLWDIKRSIDAQEAQTAFNRAMLAAQREMPIVIRDAVNEQTHSKFAKLEKIEKLIRPVYTRYGFVVTFN